MRYYFDYRHSQRRLLVHNKWFVVFVTDKRRRHRNRTWAASTNGLWIIFVNANSWRDIIPNKLTRSWLFQPAHHSRVVVRDYFVRIKVKIISSVRSIQVRETIWQPGTSAALCSFRTIWLEGGHRNERFIFGRIPRLEVLLHRHRRDSVELLCPPWL